MDKTYAPTAQCPGESSRTILDHLAHLGTNEEHVALLVSLGTFDLLRRKGDLFDKGVAAVFGLAGGEVELLALCFHVRKFTPAGAALWLAGRGIAPLIFVSNSGRIAARDWRHNNRVLRLARAVSIPPGQSKNLALAWPR